MTAGENYDRAERLAADNADPIAAGLLAVAEAVNGLVYEQRTANLIGLLGLADHEADTGSDEHATILAVCARLELTQTIDQIRAGRD